MSQLYRNVALNIAFFEWHYRESTRRKVDGSTMSKEGQDEWVFDSLVGLLRGPVWNVPILTFIEHKSLSE